MTRVVTLGEVMLRLKPPGVERLFQSPMLEATFGGAEANVAASLAQFGVDARFVSAIPANNVGDACVAELRAFGVDTSMIKRQGERLGIYFLENGANQRPSRVTYDRSGSSIATLKASELDWDAVFEGADWFHISGVTPAISATQPSCRSPRSRGARAKVSPFRATTTTARISGGTASRRRRSCGSSLAGDGRHRERRRLPEGARYRSRRRREVG